MEEKVIIESTKLDVKKLAKIWGIVTGVLLLIAFLFIYLPEYTRLEGYSWAEDILAEIFFYTFWLPLLVSAFFFGLVVLALKFNKIVVTDKRVYAEALFGNKMDLSMDEVSAVASGWFGRIVIGATAGKIAFALIGNAREIHAEVRKLILKRQGVEVFSEEAPAQETPAQESTEA